MSTEANTILEEQAHELIEYFTGNPARFDEQLEATLKSGDWDELRRLVKLGKDIQFDLEYRPDEVGDVY